MKYTLLLVFSLIIGAIPPLQAQTESEKNGEAVVPGSLIIKFREDSPAYLRWLYAQRKGSIGELIPFIGIHSSSPLICDANIIALTKRFQSLNPAKISSNPVDKLRRMAVVSFSSTLDVFLLARKLSKMPGIEYAEPLPRRYCTSIPNDSLFSQQYHLTNIHANEAWDVLPASTNPILLAIVDTGVDYDHVDLRENMFINPGEVGKDNQGRDKQTNDVDDDKNGFIDDWHGWDFAGMGDGKTPDNDPYPGNAHGTHVAGLAGAIVNNKIGVAGVCNHIRLLPVKIGGDPTFLTGVIRSYDGVAYAAAMGASVINCSWGGPMNSQAEQEVINTAIASGSVVVAAFGNDGAEAAFYPAAYQGVLSVAAVGSDDRRSIFSNYHATVKISAPGTYILSTFPYDDYATDDGTSMSSPIVAGTVAMVRLMYPELTPEQAIARVIATADNIEAKNTNRPWSGKMGWGRVNTLRAVSDANVRYLAITKHNIVDDDGDGIFDIGNTIRIQPTFHNILAPVGNARGVVRIITANTNILLSDSLVNIGSLATGEIKLSPKSFSFTVPSVTASNTKVEFYIDVFENDVLIGHGLYSMILRPTYRTLRGNNIAVTINSSGNYAFNDYPQNEQGEGFSYKGSPNLLYEAGLMIGTAPDKLSDVVRGVEHNRRNFSFLVQSPINLVTPSINAPTEAQTQFADSKMLGEAGVEVHQVIVQDTLADLNNSVLVAYDIINRNASSLDSLYCGIYADWDIGTNGDNNVARYDSRGFYYVSHVSNTSLPVCGMKLLSNQTLNMFMMDNNGNESQNPGVYDGYTREEKWQTMSSGIKRQVSNVEDVSAVIGAGPMTLQPGDSVRVVFGIFAAPTLAELAMVAEKSEARAKDVFGSTPAPVPVPKPLQLTIYPNPFSQGDKNRYIVYSLPGETYLRCDLVDLFGRSIAEILPGQTQTAGDHTVPINIDALGITGFTLSQTSYYLRLHTNFGTVVEPLIIHY